MRQIKDIHGRSGSGPTKSPKTISTRPKEFDLNTWNVPPEIRESFLELTSVETAKMDRRTLDEIDQDIFDVARRGMLQSSGAMQSVVKTVGNSLPIRTQTAFGILLRSLTAHGVAVDDASKNALKELLSNWIKEHVTYLKQIVENTAPFKSGRISGYGLILKDLDVLGDLENRRICGEIDLIATQNDRVEMHSGNASTLVFNAPVGMVQSGSGNFGSVVQHIDAGATEALTKALDQLAAALQDCVSGQQFDADEVSEMVADAKLEVAKERPNATRLRALVSGIGNAIAFMPKLKPAYETLKWAASMVGVTLP